MSALKILFLFCATFSFSKIYSQNIKMNAEVKKIIQLGKDSIVQLALQRIDEGVTLENFKKIKVYTNGKEVYVSFRNPIKYLPIASVYYFDVGVQLIEKVTQSSPLANGIFEYTNADIPYYKETAEGSAALHFISEAVNSNRELGSLNLDNFEDTMIIHELENYYDVSIVSEFQESSYHVEKITGKISNTEHAHLVSPPLKTPINEVFVEIQ